MSGGPYRSPPTDSSGSRLRRFLQVLFSPLWIVSLGLFVVLAILGYAFSLCWFGPHRVVYWINHGIDEPRGYAIWLEYTRVGRLGLWLADLLFSYWKQA